MERKLRKLLALVTAFSLSMSLLGVTAFADENNSPPTADTGTSAAEHSHNPVACSTCNGTHKITETQDCPDCEGPAEVDMVECPKCEGEGQVLTWDFDHVCPICNEKGCTDNPMCFMGYELYPIDCSNCSGTGEIPDPDAVVCPTCKGSGEIEVPVDCPDCDENGKVACTGSFDSGVLTAVNSDSGEGTMTYTCAACGASYTETLSAEETLQLVCSNIKVTFTAPAFVQAGKSLTYTVKVTNNNNVAAKGLAIFLKFSKNVTDVSVKNVVSPDFDADTHTLKMNLDLFGPAQTSKGPNSKTITVTAKTVSGEGEDQTVTVEPGDEVTVDWTVDYQTQTVDSGSAVTTISKYPVVKKVTLAGLNLGYRYYANAKGPDATNMETPLNSFVCTFDSLETQALSFDDALGADNGFPIDFPFSKSGSVQNCKTDRTWVCVGFVPYSSYGYTDMGILKNYMFSKTGEDGFKTGSLDDAKNFVTQNGGVCYGEVASDEQIEGFVKATGKSDSFVLMTVWYLPGTAGFELRDGYDLTIPAVPSASYQPTSQGVEIKPDLDSVHAVDGKPHTFEGELTVTIGSSAPNTIHINLSDALTALMGRAAHLDNNAIQPGDVMNYHVKLVNNSGKDFQYVADSAFAATVDRYVDGQQSLGTGFDGYQIAASLPDGGTEFCAIPRRVANDALKFLGVDKDLSDEAIGALLRAKGYGDGEELTPAQITQKYLAPFYLDFLNSQRAEDAQLAHSFLDLTGAEFARLTNYDNQNGDQPRVPETCETVAQAFYYFYYGVNYTVNGTSIYDQMKDHAAMDQLVSDALSGDGTYTLASQIAGETTNNAFQDTTFRFGMQFSMAYTATSAPDGPGGGGGGGRDDDPTPPAPPVDIPEEPTPLAPLPSEDVTPEQPTPDADAPLTDLPDEEVPKADVPKTGDASLLWLALSGLSGSGLAALALQDRRKKHDN